MWDGNEAGPHPALRASLSHLSGRGTEGEGLTQWGEYKIRPSLVLELRRRYYELLS